VPFLSLPQASAAVRKGALPLAGAFSMMSQGKRRLVGEVAR
jgi:hypothetical protein